MASNRYCIDIAKRGTAGCKECKEKIEKSLVRIGIIIPNPFTDSGGDMKQWFHVPCIFKKLSRARLTTKKIENEDDLEGWDEIDEGSKKEVLQHINDFWGDQKPTEAQKKAKKAKSSPLQSPPQGKRSRSRSRSPKSSSPGPSGKKQKSGEDDTFRQFRKVCAEIADRPEYKKKTEILAEFFKRGSSGNGFHGDLYLWIKMLLPGVEKRIYNLQSKQLIKLFSQIFGANQDKMLNHLEQGDVAETVRIFFEMSKTCPPTKKSTLTLQDVEDFLEQLSKLTREEDQMNVLRMVAERCTANDLRMFVRLIKHDLQIHAGAKHILDALHPEAYQAFHASHNLKDVVTKTLKQLQSGGSSRALTVKASLMTPVKPMLAEPCRSVGYAFQKCPNGPLVEIKYDGERVQIHKKGHEFSYFSRSLKPVLPSKVMHFRDYIPKAFPYGNDLMLDSEILLVDSGGKPLPFGTLGEHKKKAFKDATVCLFIFDCLQFNDENLMNKPLEYRRKVLQENIKPVKSHVMLSEMKAVETTDELKEMMKSVMSQGLEGLLIKDKKSIYEPGKRHWLKMKKDYLDEGAMADSADLVVLGAYYGTGRKGGMMSVFLMGCWDAARKQWCTVTKVGGHKDAVLNKLQKSLKMEKISKDPSKVPSWLDVSKSLIPDFVAVDPQQSQVWEITGAEFTKAEAHTADGISIRFPRVARIRDDKTPKEATTLKMLKKLYEKSKETTDMVGLGSTSGTKRKSPERSPSPSRKRRSMSPQKASSSGSSQRSRSRSRSRTPAKKKSETTKPKRKRSSSKSPARKLQSSPDSKTTFGTTLANREGPDSVSDCGLPNIFTDVKLYLSPSLEQYQNLKRYFVAYDGICLKEHEKMDASYVVTSSSDDKCLPTASRVSPDWLWDCVKLKKLLPIDQYLADAGS